MTGDLLSPTQILIPAAAFGLVFGSFVTAVSYRLPRGQSFAAGRSQCPHCKTALTARDLVPVLSWALNRGRCRHCNASVSARYPLIELTTAVVFVSAAWRVHDLVELMALCAAGAVMVALAVIDLEHRRLPLPLLLVLAALLLTLGWMRNVDLTSAVGLALGIAVGGVALAAASRALTGTPILGAADAYALSVGALAQTWQMTVVFAGLAGLLGLIVGLGWRLATGQNRFPFGPAIFASLWACLLSPGLFTAIMDRFAA
ncbi:MAG: prepilin peptidase [Rhodospirillaceae bacterium]|nr:prepilin peptidase [Rhodospirillaceae bacterium]